MMREILAEHNCTVQIRNEKHTSQKSYFYMVYSTTDNVPKSSEKIPWDSNIYHISY